MFTVYFKLNNKYISFNGLVSRTTDKIPSNGFYMNKPTSYDLDGLIAYHKQLEIEQAELSKIEWFKLNYLEWNSHDDAKVRILNGFLPAQYRFTKGKRWFHQFPNVKFQEHIFMNNCNNGGMIYHKVGDYNNVHAYDWNNFFSSILGGCKSQFKIPISEAKYETIQELPKTLKYGIYRALVVFNGPADDDIHKVINFSSAHHYTHMDLQTILYYSSIDARLTVRMICDEYPNVMYYEKFIRSKELFGKWYKYLSGAKDLVKKNSVSKSMLNIWGHLCASEQYKFQARNETISKWSIKKQNKYIFTPNDNMSTDCMIQYQKKDNLYRYSLARMKPFLMSASRKRIVNIIGNTSILPMIVRIYTDGIIATERIEKLDKLVMTIKKDKYHGKDISIKSLTKIVIKK